MYYPEIQLTSIPKARAYMYILSCKDWSLYVGSTKELALRVEQHQSGEGANHTRKFGPVKLIYYECFARIDHAFNREQQIKKWSRAKKVALIDANYRALHELAKRNMPFP